MEKHHNKFTFFSGKSLDFTPCLEDRGKKGNAEYIACELIKKSKKRWHVGLTKSGTMYIFTPYGAFPMCEHGRLSGCWKISDLQNIKKDSRNWLEKFIKNQKKGEIEINFFSSYIK